MLFEGRPADSNFWLITAILPSERKTPLPVIHIHFTRCEDSFIIVKEK